MYEYRAKVISIYDADTFRLDIDVGLNIWLRNQSVRLLGVQAPEVRGEERSEGIRWRDWARVVILGDFDGRVSIRTHRDKKGKYGRWLVEVFYGLGWSLNQLLVDYGHPSPESWGHVDLEGHRIDDAPPDRRSQ